jgi:hypothetical protein
LRARGSDDVLVAGSRQRGRQCSQQTQRHEQGALTMPIHCHLGPQYEEKLKSSTESVVDLSRTGH